MFAAVDWHPALAPLFHAERLLEIAPEHAVALSVRATDHAHHERWRAYEEDISLAIGAGLEVMWAWRDFGAYLLLNENHAQLDRLIGLAWEQDPESPVTHWLTILDPKRAIPDSELQAVIESSPYSMIQGIALYLSGDLEAACERLADDRVTPASPAYLAVAKAELGQEMEAEDALKLSYELLQAGNLNPMLSKYYASLVKWAEAKVLGIEEGR